MWAAKRRPAARAGCVRKGREGRGGMACEEQEVGSASRLVAGGAHCVSWLPCIAACRCLYPAVCVRTGSCAPVTAVVGVPPSGSATVPALHPGELRRRGGRVGRGAWAYVRTGRGRHEAVTTTMLLLLLEPSGTGGAVPHTLRGRRSLCQYMVRCMAQASARLGGA